MLTFDDIRDLREEWEATLSPAAYRARIEEYVGSMATGDPGRTELLSTLAGDLWRYGPTEDEYERAAALARDAIADGGDVTIDPRVELIGALTRLGREDEVQVLLRECLRDQTPENVHIDIHSTLGEILELLDRSKQAHRAYTVGLKRYDPEFEEELDFGEAICLAGRFRVRRQLGLGRDSLDLAFEQTSPTAAQAIVERLGDDAGAVTGAVTAP